MPAKTGFIERAYQKIGQLLNVLPAEEKAVSLAAINSALFGTDLGQSSGIATSSKSYQTLVDAYQSWVYICIDKIAKTVAMLPLGLYAYKKNGKWIDGHQIKTKIKTLENKKEISRYMKMDDVEKIAINNHPFLDVLKKPNPASTRFILWYDTMVRMELAGSCAWYYSKNKFGQPLEIFALPIKSSATLSIIPDDKLIYGKFKYQDGNKVTMFDPSEIMFMRYPHPGSIYEGMSPLLSQTYPYDIDDFLSKQQYALFKNNTIYGGALFTDKDLNKDAVTNIRNTIETNKGALKSGKWAIFHSGLRYESMAQTAKDMMLKDVAEYAREKLLSAYDVSAGKAGLVKDVNRANGEFLNETFYKECINPKTMLIEEYIESYMLPLYDENLTMDFELPDFYDEQKAVTIRTANLVNGYTTINEERAKEGLDPVDWGELPWLPFSVSQPDGKNDVEINEEKPEIPKPSEEENPEERQEERDEEIEGEAVKTKENDYNYLQWKKFVAREERYEKILIKKLNKHFKAQLNEVLDSLGTKGIRIEGNIAGWGKAKIAEWLKEKDRLSDINIDVQKWQKKLIEDTEAEYEFIITDHAGNKLSEFAAMGIDVSETLNMNDPRAKKYLADRLKEYSKEVTGTTHDKIKAILKEGFQEGASVTVISDRLREKFADFEKYRAPLIARTETASAMNKSEILAVKQEGLEDDLLKFWIASHDAAVRDTHLQAESDSAKGISIDDLFHVGADTMDAPGNGSIAGEVINCRCTMGYLRKK